MPPSSGRNKPEDSHFQITIFNRVSDRSSRDIKCTERLHSWPSANTVRVKTSHCRKFTSRQSVSVSNVPF